MLAIFNPFRLLVVAIVSFIFRDELLSSESRGSSWKREGIGMRSVVLGRGQRSTAFPAGA